MRLLTTCLLGVVLASCDTAPAPSAACTLPDGRVLDVAGRLDGIYGVEADVVGAAPLAHFDRSVRLEDGVDAESGKRWVKLRLAEGEADAFRAFTTQSSGRSIAVVVDGEVACQHKVRAAITSDEIQVSCCNPRACEKWQALVSPK